MRFVIAVYYCFFMIYGFAIGSAYFSYSAFVNLIVDRQMVEAVGSSFLFDFMDFPIGIGTVIGILWVLYSCINLIAVLGTLVMLEQMQKISIGTTIMGSILFLVLLPSQFAIMGLIFMGAMALFLYFDNKKRWVFG